MRKLFVIIQSILFIFIISSCNRSEKKNEKQPSDTSEVKSAQPATGNLNEPTESSRVNSTENEQNSDNQNDDTITGQQLVTKVANQLIDRLALTDKQQTDVKDILQKTFLGMGEDLNNKYTKEKARAVHMDVIKKSFDQISMILNDNQKERFNRFHQHLK